MLHVLYVCVRVCIKCSVAIVSQILVRVKMRAVVANAKKNVVSGVSLE